MEDVGSVSENQILRKMIKRSPYLGEPGWLSRLGVPLMVSAQVLISRSWDQDPHRAPCTEQNLLEILPLTLRPAPCSPSLQ